MKNDSSIHEFPPTGAQYKGNAHGNPAEFAKLPAQARADADRIITITKGWKGSGIANFGPALKALALTFPPADKTGADRLLAAAYALTLHGAATQSGAPLAGQNLRDDPTATPTPAADARKAEKAGELDDEALAIIAKATADARARAAAKATKAAPAKGKPAAPAKA